MDNLRAALPELRKLNISGLVAPNRPAAVLYQGQALALELCAFVLGLVSLGVEWVTGAVFKLVS